MALAEPLKLVGYCCHDNGVMTTLFLCSAAALQYQEKVHAQLQLEMHNEIFQFELFYKFHEIF